MLPRYAFESPPNSVIPEALNAEATFPGYRRPVEGMASVPEALRASAVEAGVASTANEEAIRVERVAEGDWLVTFRKTATSPCTHVTVPVLDDDGEEVVTTVRARRLVLALTKAALGRLAVVDRVAEGRLQGTIQSLCSQVTSLALQKIFAAWPTRWWETVRRLDAFSTTQSPTLAENRSAAFVAGRFLNDRFNQLFAWYPGTQARPRDVAPSCAASGMGVLQAYVFARNVVAYEQAADFPAQRACAQLDDCGECFEDTQDWAAPGIPTKLVDLLLQDLSTIFRKDVEPPSELMTRVYTDDNPVTGTSAVHTWKSNCKFWDSYVLALAPVEGDETFHLVGETFSYNQGWVEGALETAEHLLQEILDMDAPPWLDRHHYCASFPFYPSRRTP